ncbi:uncharacterized protein LOC131901291 isoform X2 [Peromyscus eremicus]|uniref:uncharacterized protein LOC131901291 isoform X2 n=1 Tax=Peromyscus eremicus TaxID=42410 RepID=UPI0027DAB9F6|nr:uncharacterized protein LOC131901291 isoform X2 [Peromyscus eremicus]
MLFNTKPKILEGSPSPLLSQYETISPWVVVSSGVTTSCVLLVLGHYQPTALAGPGSALEAPSLLATLTWKLGSADLRPSWQLYCSPCVILSKVSPGSKLEFSTADLPSSLHLNIILQGFIKYLYKNQDRYPLKVHILSSLHPATEGSRYRDPQPSTRPSSRSQLKRGNKNEEDGVMIMMGKSTETTGPSSWKLTNFRPTAVEPSWDYTTPCMREKLGLFEGPLAVGSIPGA